MTIRILHVLDAPHGGATIGALELMRFSLRESLDLEHFAVYPSLERAPDFRVRIFCHGCTPVPMRWWHIKPGLNLAQRALIWWRERQATRSGQTTEEVLQHCIEDWAIDVVHTNTSAVIDGARVAHRLGLPHVWHIRETVGSRGSVRFRLSDQALAELIGSLSAWIVPMSQAAAELFLRHGQSGKTRVVYDGIDIADFDDPDAVRRGWRLRRLWGVADHELLIGTVGGLAHRVKRHDIFIRAAGQLAKRHPSLRFAAIGVLPRREFATARVKDRYFRWLSNLVHAEGLDDRFHWIPLVPDSGAVMNAIDVLAHTSELEGFGRVAPEAMAAKRPVVGPAAGGIAESVVDHVTGYLVPPGDALALADALEQIVVDSRLRTRLGQAGQDRVRESFSPKQYVSAMSEIYRDSIRQSANHS
jgi:glycosyltransferase involved in cell wall biosynthesis